MYRTRVLTIGAVAICCWAVFTPHVRAEVQTDPPSQAVVSQRLEQATVQLQSALTRLEAFLNHGSQDNAQAWKRFLRWNSLEESLRAQDPEVDIGQEVLLQYLSGHAGLELPEFVAVRRALRRYLAIAAYALHPQKEAVHEGQIELLRTSLSAHESDPSPATAAEIGRTLEWLDTVGGQTGLVRQLRQRFSRPNLYVSMSDTLIAARAGRQVNEWTEIHQCILGTSIHGRGQVRAEVSARPIACPTDILVQVVLDGNLRSDTRGYNGPVTIRSVGNTRMLGRQRLCISRDGLQVLSGSAECDARTQIRSISAGGRLGSNLVERIAWRRAGSQKSTAEAIASRQAESRLVQRMDRTAREMAREANSKYENRVRRPLRRAGLFPRVPRMYSTPEAVKIEALQAKPWQIAAEERPPRTEISGDVNVHAHQSFINNSIDTVLRGLTLTDERLVELLEQRNVEVPEELKITPEKEPWSISFDHSQPVRVEFDQGVVRIALRGRQFVRGDRPLDELVEISATYELEPTDHGAVLHRQGPVEVDFLNLPKQVRGLRGTRIVGYRTFIRRKFDTIFSETLAPRDAPMASKMEMLQDMKLASLATRDGWLTATWSYQRDDSSAPEAKAKAKVASKRTAKSQSSNLK